MDGNMGIRTITKIEANPALFSRTADNRKLKVAAYCRVSTDEEDQLNSLETQMKHYTGKISENSEWTFAGIYADEGISGTSVDKRKEFMRLMRDCQKGKVDYILTKSTTRFARNTVDSLTWVRKLRAIGVGVMFEEQNLDSLKAENETFIGFYSVMAQSESESISGNVKWGVRKRMKNGTYKVRFDLLGYSVDKDGNPYIVPAEAEAVRTIFKMFLDGASLLQLQQYLEGNGFKTPRGNSVWQRSVISYMLKNEKYVGDVLYQKTYRRDCISKKVLRNNGELTRYLISNNHPAIIDRETFNLVQLEIARRSNKRKKSDKGLTELGKYSGKYALTDLLVCGCCGGAYKRTCKNETDKKVYYWRCINRIDHGTTACRDSFGIEEKKLHSAILRCLSKMMSDREEVVRLIQSNLQYGISGNAATLDVYNLENQIAQLNEDMTIFMDRAASTGGDVDKYEAELKKMFEQLTALRNLLETAKSQAAQSETVNNEVARLTALLMEADLNFSEFDDVTIRRIVECIQVNTDKHILVTLKGGLQGEELI